MPDFALKDQQAQGIAAGNLPASTDSETQTMAVSKLMPGSLVNGQTVGQTGNGIPATDIKVQAYTNPLNSMIPKATDSGTLTSGAGKSFTNTVLSDLDLKKQAVNDQIASLSTLGGNQASQQNVLARIPDEYKNSGWAKELQKQADNGALVPDNIINANVTREENQKYAAEQARPAKEALTQSSMQQNLSQSAANVRQGIAGTQTAQMVQDDLSASHAREMQQLAQKQADIVNQAMYEMYSGRAKQENNIMSKTADLYKQLDDIDKQKAQQNKDYLQNLKDVQALQKADTEQGGFLYSAAKNGVVPSETQFSANDKLKGYQPGMSKLLFAATQSAESLKSQKENRDAFKAELDIQTTLENLSDKPMERQAKLLDLQSKLQASKDAVYSTITKISDAIAKAPPGMVIPIGDAEYFGLQGVQGAFIEKDSNSIGRIGGYDSNGVWKQQNLGFIGDPTDIETVYVNGAPQVRNRRTGQTMPVTNGIANSPADGGWENIIPNGAAGGQCGAFCHNIVADYPYGLNSLSLKEQAINVPKGALPKVGDVLVQDVGTESGHAAVVNWVGQDPTGKNIMRLTESNWHGDEKVQHTRTMPIDSPQVMGFFRGQVRPEFRTGSDSPTVSSTGNAQISTRNPFIVPNVPMTAAQQQDADQKFRQAKSGAQALINGGSKDDIPLEVRTEAMDIARQNGWVPSVSDEKILKGADDLRKEFQALPEVKEFKVVRDSYAQIQEASKNPSAAGDLALIFSYMKLLDPGSTVREGEFANAQNAAGIPDRIRNLWNKSIDGERLNEKQRADFVTQAEKTYKSRERQIQPTINQYTTLSEKRKLDPNDVIFDIKFSERPSQAPPSGQIWVKKKDGQIGSIPSSEFNSKEYVKL